MDGRRCVSREALRLPAAARLPRTGPNASPYLAGVLEGLADYDSGELAIDQLVVYSSELYRGGPEYYSLATCPLGMQGH